MKSQHELTIQRMKRNEIILDIGDKVASALISLLAIGLMAYLFGW